MNELEHYLTCLAEECAEVSQRVSKALRFGLSEVQKGQPLTNAERITEELEDLIGVATLLRRRGAIGSFQPTLTQIEVKDAKIRKFMAISLEQGTLQEPEARVETMRGLLARWRQTGCPHCNGDCGSANPPVMSCLMLETSAALKGK